MLLRLSRTAQANASGYCRACLALPSWRAIVAPWTSRQPRPGHQRSFGGRPDRENDLVDTAEVGDSFDKITDEALMQRRMGTTTIRTTAGALKAAGLRRAWLSLRLNRVTSSLPCMFPDGVDNEGQWSMQDDNDGLAKAIEAICVPQVFLKNNERALELREAHLDSLHHVYFRSSRISSCSLELAQVAEAQHEEENDHVRLVRERATSSSASGCGPEATEDVVYDPRGLPIHETDIQQLDTDHNLEEELHAGPYRGPRKDLHATRSHRRIVKLVDDLMKQAVTERFRGQLKPIRRAMESLDGPWTALEMLKLEGYPKYQSASINPVAAAEGIKTANNHSRMLFARWEGAIDEEQIAIKRKKHGTPSQKEQEDSPLTTTMLYKICFNLLAQPYEPEVHTFNTLILGFTTVGEHRLARIVVDSFLRSKLIPTKSTIVIMLHHYYASNDILGFYHWVRRMIGIDSKGVGIRRVQLSTTEDQGGTFIPWAERENVSLHGDWLVTRSWLDAREMEALLKGLIFFGQAQHASQILSISLKRGYAIQTTTFTDLLALVGSRLDHDAASLLVRGLCSNAEDLASLLLEDEYMCPTLLVAQLRRVLDIYAVRLSMEMGTKKYDWWESPVNSEDEDARKQRRDLLANAAQLLVTETPRRTNQAERFLPGLSTILIALRIKEISLQLTQLDDDLDDIRKRIDAAFKTPDTSLAPRFQAWWRQRFPPQENDTPIWLPFMRYQRSLKLRERRRSMAQLHILAEQVELLVEDIAESLSTFGQMSIVPPDVRDAIYASIPSVSVDSCVKLAHRHYKADWLAAAQGQRSANAAVYEAAMRRRKWSWKELKRLQIEANVAIQASLRISFRIKSRISRALPLSSCDLLLDTYGTWRRVPIEELAKLAVGVYNGPPPKVEDKETRLVQPVTRYWNPKTNPFHYLATA